MRKDEGKVMKNFTTEKDEEKDKENMNHARKRGKGGGKDI